MNREGTIVELTGLAGSGKSYVKSMIETALRDAGLPCDTVRLTPKDLVTPALPALVYRALKVVLLSRPKDLSRFLNSARHWFLVQLLYRKIRHRGSVAVVDEGVIHKVRALRRNSSFAFMFADIPLRWLDSIILPDVLVVVHCTAKDIVERRKQRDGIALNDMEVIVERSMNVTDQDARHLAGHAGTQVLRLDNSVGEGVDSQVKALVHVIAGLHVG